MRRLLRTIAMLGLASAVHAGDTFNAEKIHGFGSKGNRINLVIVGDGWSQADLDSGAYKKACADLTAGLLKQEPLATYANFLTVTRVDVPSPKSGATHEFLWMGERTTGAAPAAPATPAAPAAPTAPATPTASPGAGPGPGPGPGPAATVGTTSTAWTPPTSWTGLPIVAGTPATFIVGTKIYRRGLVLGSYYQTWFYAGRVGNKHDGAVLSVDRSVFLRDDFTDSTKIFGFANMKKKVQETNADLPRNVTAVLVNDKTPGGAAIPGIFCFSSEPGLVKTMTHELGHALAKLGDEYIEHGNEPTTPIPADADLPPNLTTNSDKTTVKWKHWVGSEGIDAPIQGGLYRTNGVWRPKDNCMMRQHWAAPFCAVCQEETVRRLLTNVSLVDTVAPLARAIDLNVGGSQTFKVHCVGPKKDKIEGNWYLDGKPIKGTKSETSQGPIFEASLGPDVLVAGKHEVRCVVNDKTPLIKDAKGGVAEYKRRPNQRYWYVSVKEPSRLPKLFPFTLFE